jgi:ATP-dependent exoDNAse (exonuclease V) alpha subunit
MAKRRKYKNPCERYMDYAHQLVGANRLTSAKRAVRLYVRCVKKEMSAPLPEWRDELVKKWEPEYLLSEESVQQRMWASERRAARRRGGNK